MDQECEELVQYTHINHNDFLYRKHRKQREEDIAVCVCKYDVKFSDSACGERCLNVLTSTECTPGYCPCGVYCKNQKFQKCEYAKTKFFKTDGRGWGLLADEYIKAGQFIIEYCGEVISWKEAKKRSETYESSGMRDAYIISLNAHESIDATRKGSLARFINHSCEPNCETRKWTVLGEIRVGIFAKQDICLGTELAYDYNFEWYGGAKVRCLCGAHSCSGFLGAKSRGFQEDTHLWEENDDRYTVEKIPLYDSAEDEPSAKLTTATSTPQPEPIIDTKVEYSMTDIREHEFESTAAVVDLLDSVPFQGALVNVVKPEGSEQTKLQSEDTQHAYKQKHAMISHIQSNTACRNYHVGAGPVPKKRAVHYPTGRLKNTAQMQVDANRVAQHLSSKDAQEVIKSEEERYQATSQLDSLYNEIRPAIEEHERDSQDSVPTSVAEQWIEACCFKFKTEFDFHLSIIKNLACAPPRARIEAKPPATDDNATEVKYLTY